jgi:Zn finger protein HypA/HybF involved in hydrogenase expression
MIEVTNTATGDKERFAFETVPEGTLAHALDLESQIATLKAKCSTCQDDMEAAWNEREAILQAKHDEEMAEAVWWMEKLERRLSFYFEEDFGPSEMTTCTLLHEFGKAKKPFLAAHKENCPQCGDFGSKCEVCGCPGPNETKEEPKVGEGNYE